MEGDVADGRFRLRAPVLAALHVPASLDLHDSVADVSPVQAVQLCGTQAGEHCPGVEPPPLDGDGVAREECDGLLRVERLAFPLVVDAVGDAHGGTDTLGALITATSTPGDELERNYDSKRERLHQATKRPTWRAVC
jgi:hypothetical protein